MGEEQASCLKGLLQSSTARVPVVLLQRVEEIIPAVRESLIIMGEEQASCLGGLLQTSTARVPIVLLQRVEEIIPAVKESLNCMDIPKSEPGPCSGTCQISSDDGNEVVGIKVEDVADVKEEEDPGPSTSSGIKTEPAVVTDDEQASHLERLLLSSTASLPIDLQQSVEEVIPAVRESLNCIDILKSEPVPCSGTSDDGNEVVGKSIEEVTDVKVEEDPATSTGIKTEPANCVDVLRGEHESCTETCAASCGDGKQFVFVNVDDDDDSVMKWQEDPEPTTSTAVKSDPVICVNLLRSDSGSYSETSLMSLDDEKCGVGIKVEEVTDTEGELNPQPIAFKTIKAEPERTVNGQLCTCSGNFATSCDACNKAFGERIFSCDVCNKTFSCRDFLITHQQIHSGEWPFTCHVCNTIFVQKPHLIQHLQMHIEDRLFSCDVCHKAFEYVNLKNHKRIHSGERPFVCDVCDVAFFGKKTLVQHKRIHSGNRTFLCDVCNKIFVSHSSLVIHKRVHSGERPFSCDICNKAFIQKGHLKKHKLIHSGLRPFPCEVCHKIFLRNGDLMKHKQVHSRERPFVCGVCCKVFNWKRSLVRHMQKHSADETSLVT